MPPAEFVDRVSNAYVNAVREKPLLDKQGDGMKSYAGILFEAIVADLDITLIDEPEAFLQEKLRYGSISRCHQGIVDKARSSLLKCS